MSSDDDRSVLALATILNAVKPLSKWSHKVKSLDDAKAHLLEAFSAEAVAHKQQHQVALLPEIVRAPEQGRRATVLELIKKQSCPAGPRTP